MSVSEPRVDNPPAPGRRAAALALAGIVVLLALPVRLYLAGSAAMLSRDGVTFIRCARAMEHEPLAVMRSQPQHPLYPAAILAAHATMRSLGPAVSAVLHDPIRGWTLAAVLVALAGGLAVVVGVYLVTAGLFGPPAGLAAAAMTALAAEFCRISADGLSDMPHLALYLAALAAVLRGLRQWRTGWFLLGGLLSGMAFLCRPEGAEVAMVAAAALLVFPRNRLRRQRWKAAAAVALGALLIASPYMAITGKVVQKKSPWKLLLPSAGQAPPAPSLQAAAEAPVRAGVDGRGLLSVGEALKIIGEKWGRALRVTLLLPALWWLFGGRPAGDAPGVRLVGALMLVHLLILIGLILRMDYADLLSLRHVLVLAGLTMPFAGAGVIQAGQRLHARRPGVAAAVLIGLLIAPTLPWLVAVPYADDVYLRRAGEWIRRHSAGPTPRVMAERHRVAFYADGEPIVFQESRTAGEVLELARRTRPEWLVLDERRTLRSHPGFLDELARSLSPGETLELVHTEAGGGRRTASRALIYRYAAGP